MVIKIKDIFINQYDKEQINTLKTNLEEKSNYFNEVCTAIVTQYAGDLDSLMKWIYQVIIQPDIPADSDSLEKAFLELSNCVYFTYENLEHVGIFETLSKATYKEVYNDHYISNIEKDGEKRNKKTVAELTAIAESNSQYESILSDIYSAAYSIIKNKISAAQTMIATLSKIMSKRMQESQSSDNSGRRRLVEEY